MTCKDSNGKHFKLFLVGSEEVLRRRSEELEDWKVTIDDLKSTGTGGFEALSKVIADQKGQSYIFDANNVFDSSTLIVGDRFCANLLFTVTHVLRPSKPISVGEKWAESRAGANAFQFEFTYRCLRLATTRGIPCAVVSWSLPLSRGNLSTDRPVIFYLDHKTFQPVLSYGTFHVWTGDPPGKEQVPCLTIDFRVDRINGGKKRKSAPKTKRLSL